MIWLNIVCQIVLQWIPMPRGDIWSVISTARSSSATQISTVLFIAIQRRFWYTRLVEFLSFLSSTWLGFSVCSKNWPTYQLYRANKIIFPGEHVPVFDIAELYAEGEPQNMLVSNAKFGAGLATKFTKEQESSMPKNTSPDHSVVLMKKHGFTTLGTDIPATVFRALYTQTNAVIQTNALLLQKAATPRNWPGAGQDFGGLVSLSAKEARDCQKLGEGTQERPWGLWVREVEACPLYVNKMPKAM
jgi:hypothetical protein